MKRCVLHADKVCNDCGECDDRCELDPQKICDNCFKCLEADTRHYAEMPIAGVFFEDDFSPEKEGHGTEVLGEGYVLDSDESWKESPAFCCKTLPLTHGVRKRRRR